MEIITSIRKSDEKKKDELFHPESWGYSQLKAKEKPPQTPNLGNITPRQDWDNWWNIG